MRYLLLCIPLGFAIGCSETGGGINPTQQPPTSPVAPVQPAVQVAAEAKAPQFVFSAQMGSSGKTSIRFGITKSCELVFRSLILPPRSFRSWSKNSSRPECLPRGWSSSTKTCTTSRGDRRCWSTRIELAASIRNRRRRSSSARQPVAQITAVYPKSMDAALKADLDTVLLSAEYGTP